MGTTRQICGICGKHFVVMFSKSMRCKSFHCMYFAPEGQKHCSYCMRGIEPVNELERLHECKRYNSHMNALVRKHVASDELLDALRTMTNSDEPPILEFLKRVVWYEKKYRLQYKIMFAAKQIVHLFTTYTMRNFPYTFPISAEDQILCRVLDWWNLRYAEGFPPSVECYWVGTNFMDGHPSVLNAIYGVKFRTKQLQYCGITNTQTTI